MAARGPTLGERREQGSTARIIVHAIFAAAVLFVILHHEPWRDEADSWLLARDSSISEMFRVMPYAGTQALWYLLLEPWASAGAPFIVQSLINWIIIVAAAGLIVWRSPLPLPLSTLVCFSYYFAYEYGVIARSYGLSVLLLLLVVLAWPARDVHPKRFAAAVGLLMNANVPSLILAIGFAAGSFATMRWSSPERRKEKLLSLLIVIGAFAIGILQILPPGDVDHPQIGRVRSGQLIDAVREAFFLGTTWSLFAVLGLGIILVVAVQAAKADRALLLAYLVGLAGILNLVVFVIRAFPRHYGFVFTLTVGMAWLSWKGSSRAMRFAVMAVLLPSLLFSVGRSLQYGALETLRPFSAAKEMAEFILDHGYADAHLAGHTAAHSEAILPWLPGTRMWYTGEERYGSYMRWDAAYERGQLTPDSDVIRAAAREFANDPDFLLLFRSEIPGAEQFGLELLYATRGEPFEKTDERYWLYRPTSHFLSRSAVD